MHKKLLADGANPAPESLSDQEIEQRVRQNGEKLLVKVLGLEPQRPVDPEHRIDG